MGFLAVANAYVMRNVLNLAITEMVVTHHKKDIVIDQDSCPGPLPEIKNHTDSVSIVKFCFIFYLFFL